jgi:hypothetical protein
VKRGGQSGKGKVCSSLRDRKLSCILQEYPDLFENVYQAIKLGRGNMVKMFDLSLKGMVKLCRKERKRSLQEQKKTPVISMKDRYDNT